VKEQGKAWSKEWRIRKDESNGTTAWLNSSEIIDWDLTRTIGDF